MTIATTEKRLNIFPDPPQMFAQAAQHAATLLRAAQQQGRPAFLALAGGNTPRRLYQQLCRLPAEQAPAWSRVRFFFGDERAVPADHPDANYRMAQENLFLPLDISASQIHRIRTELPPEEAVADYQQQLLGLPQHDGWPCFDLVLLGMGNDGHIASLFPHSPLLADDRRSFTSGEVTQLATRRYSLTLPVLNHARQLMLLVTGQDKATTVQQAIVDTDPATPLPVQKLNPANLAWYMDSTAASQLTDGTPV